MVPGWQASQAVNGVDEFLESDLFYEHLWPPSQYSYLLQHARVPNLGFYLTMCLFLNACLSFLFAAESLEEADERVETDAKQVGS